MKNFCKYVKVHAAIIKNFEKKEKKEIIPLTVKESKSYHKQKACYIWKKKFTIDDEKYHKAKDHYHYTGKYKGATHDICYLIYKTPK